MGGSVPQTADILGAHGPPPSSATLGRDLLESRADPDQESRSPEPGAPLRPRRRVPHRRAGRLYLAPPT